VTPGRPPSSDSPYEKPKRKKAPKKNRKRGAQKGHQGHKQELLEPTEQKPIMPESCQCGNLQLPIEKICVESSPVVELNRTLAVAMTTVRRQAWH
jgi:hypothetical protein